MIVIMNTIKIKKMILIYIKIIIIKKMHRNYKSGRFTSNKIGDNNKNKNKKDDENKNTKKSNKYSYKFYELF